MQMPLLSPTRSFRREKQQGKQLVSLVIRDVAAFSWASRRLGARRQISGGLGAISSSDRSLFVVVVSSSSTSSSTFSPLPLPPPLLDSPLSPRPSPAPAPGLHPGPHLPRRGRLLRGATTGGLSSAEEPALALRRERGNAFDPGPSRSRRWEAARRRSGTCRAGDGERRCPGRGRGVRVRPLRREGPPERGRRGGARRWRRGGAGRRRRSRRTRRTRRTGGDGGDGGDGSEGEEGDRERLGPWGVSVAVKPGLPPLEIDALPAAIPGAGPLSGALPASEWRRLAKEAAAPQGSAAR